MESAGPGVISTQGCDWGGGGAGPGDPGGGGGGGGGGGDGSGYDSDRSADDWDGLGDLLKCPTAPPEFDATGCDKLQDAFEFLLDHANPQCRAFGQNASARHQAGNYRIMYYSGKYGGFFDGIVGLTDLAFTPGEFANTIAHEEAHALGWPDKYVDGNLQDPGPDGRYADDWGRICDSPTL